ncbi:hypothetical protein GCM10023082_32370 [Streptomyces tremellae]|uniref:Uncharacterized protein n=1 Tax=Streptomyces tremellae TaxID=1124239 RepID=A0ABP7F681_9ACTN
MTAAHRPSAVPWKAVAPRCHRSRTSTPGPVRGFVFGQTEVTVWGMDTPWIIAMAVVIAVAVATGFVRGS